MVRGLQGGNMGAEVDAETIRSMVASLVMESDWYRQGHLQCIQVDEVNPGTLHFHESMAGLTRHKSTWPYGS